MDSKSVQKKYEKLQAAKLKVEEEIKTLQNTCTHELAHIKFDADHYYVLFKVKDI